LTISNDSNTFVNYLLTRKVNMRLKDVEVKVKTEQEFWEQFIKFKGAHITSNKGPNKLLADLQRKLYAEAMSMPQDCPFGGNALRELSEKVGIDKKVVETYRKVIFDKGWLTKDHNFPEDIQKIRKVYKEEKTKGIESIVFIYKLCIC